MKNPESLGDKLSSSNLLTLGRSVALTPAVSPDEMQGFFLSC
jgi:hypothetical protein